ncbi:RIO1-domain-containing protein [Rhizophagus irregularis]|uniref:non-specific serine/threonine protein kinase n=1 Tax=Rhizophagus irregularis TaxID=588596 RepID=A0A2N1N1T9_9GLOM|nr:RIO1-domain-containing protein [Rhizophagus irregularis]
MPDIIYTLYYVPGQFDDTPENEQDEQRISPSEGSSLSAGRGVSDEAKKKNEVSDGKLSVFCQDGQQKKTLGDKQKNSDKSDRATVEQVLDPRTRIILFKMINRNVIYEINGCVSTGKEKMEIIVYKTSILVFKDRDRYVTGEFRFRHGYSKHNPRKMVNYGRKKK